MYRPDAHLILGGHADERGSEEYKKRLTERRVERTRNYLIGHGVLATAIETRSFGKEDQLNAEQINEQIATNPDLTPDDRRQMLTNLKVMVLANNRRRRRLKHHRTTVHSSLPIQRQRLLGTDQHKGRRKRATSYQEKAQEVETERGCN
jgi:hypothetical protein